MKHYRLLLLSAVLLSFIGYYSCQRSISDPGIDKPVDPPMVNMVKATITGRVVDDKGIPVSGASVKAGSVTGSTSVNGEFELKNASLKEDAGFVKVEKEGFFQGSRTFVVKANSTHFVQIELIKKTAAGTFSGSSGGNITVPNGGSISFPAAAVINTANNTAYTGAVTVQASFLNPEADNFDHIMPGDLRGIKASGEPAILQSFGMMAVELVGAGGEKLQLASGKKATVTFPIAPSLQGQAPTSIPLWHFSDSAGLWKEEGSATRQGSNYVGEVAHFSFWNVDIPSQFVKIDLIFRDPGNAPLQHYYVILRDPSNNSFGAAYTNNAGEASGFVPINKTLELTVHNKCGQVIHTQNIGPFATNTNVGIITVTNAGITAVTFTGTVQNCTGAPVANGLVNINVDNGNYRATVTNGNFSLVVHRCTNADTTAKVFAIDLDNNVEGSEVDVNVSGNSVNTGALTACGNVVAQYINFTIDGTQYNMMPPADTLKADLLQGITVFSGGNKGGGPSLSIYGRYQGSGVGTFQLIEFNVYTNNAYYRKSGNMNAAITEYGASGSGFIAGTLTGNVVKDSTTTPVYPFSGTFRIKRQN